MCGNYVWDTTSSRLLERNMKQQVEADQVQSHTIEKNKLTTVCSGFVNFGVNCFHARLKPRDFTSPHEARLINTGVSSLCGSLLIKTHSAVFMWRLNTHNMPNSIQKSVSFNAAFNNMMHFISNYCGTQSVAIDMTGSLSNPHFN